MTKFIDHEARGKKTVCRCPKCRCKHKFIKDCLSGVVWQDDTQICKFREPVEKIYGEHPRTEIEVFRL